MGEDKASLGRAREQLSTLQADMAFFEARLSLAAGSADTSYQRAQIKIYRLLGEQLTASLAQFGDQHRLRRSHDDSVVA